MFCGGVGRWLGEPRAKRPAKPWASLRYVGICGDQPGADQARTIDVEMVRVAKKQLVAREHRANGVAAQHMGGVENANAWIGCRHRIQIARIESELTLQHRDINFTSVRDSEPPRKFA